MSLRNRQERTKAAKVIYSQNIFLPDLCCSCGYACAVRSGYTTRCSATSLRPPCGSSTPTPRDGSWIGSRRTWASSMRSSPGCIWTVYRFVSKSVFQIVDLQGSYKRVLRGPRLLIPSEKWKKFEIQIKVVLEVNPGTARLFVTCNCKGPHILKVLETLIYTLEKYTSIYVVNPKDLCLP